MKLHLFGLICFAIVALGCKAKESGGGAGAAAGTTGSAGMTTASGGTTGTAGKPAGTSGSGTAGTSSGTGGSGTAGKTAGAGGGGAAGTSAGGSGGTAAAGKGGTGGASGAGGSGGAGGATVSAACKTYCTCMMTNCSPSMFPFPTGKTCETFCATGSDTAVTCWNLHCTNAATMSKTMHCPHALGDGNICPKM